MNTRHDVQLYFGLLELFNGTVANVSHCHCNVQLRASAMHVGQIDELIGDNTAVQSVLTRINARVIAQSLPM